MSTWLARNALSSRQVRRHEQKEKQIVMSSNRVLGLVLLVVGIALLAFGLNATNSVVDTVKEGVTGKYTDKTMWYIIGGLASAVLGAALTLFGGRGSRLHA